MIYPAGRYNLNFDICSICLCIFILIFFLTKKNLHFRRIRAFFMVAVLMLFCSVGELVMDITRNSNSIIFQNWQAELATFFSHIAYNSIPYVLTLYFLTITGLRYGMTHRRFLLMSAPECALILMHLIPPVRRLIYNYSGNCLYARGPLYDIYYVISAFYICYSAAVLIIHFDAIPKKDRVYVLVLCGGFITSMIIGALNPYLKATNFLQSLFMIGSFFALENDEALIDSSTRIYNTTAMIRDAYPLFHSKYKSYLIAIKLQHFNYYRLMIGINALSKVVRQIGMWMLGMTTNECMFYRIGSGEFAVLLFHSDEEKTKDMAEKIRRRFMQPWVYSENGTGITLPAQMWVSSIPDRISSEEQMLVFAESAFNDNLPKDRIYVADEMQAEQRKVDVDVAIRRALSENTFEVYYQPIYDTRSGKMHSCEALVRMNDPKLGFVSPEEFIKIAEQMGTVSEIGAVVFEKVCSFLAKEKPEQYGMDFVEVNLSTIQCMDKNLVKNLQNIMEKYGICSHQIVLEITESAVIHNEERMKQVIGELQKAGFSFALDDFGTGHANYSYVLNFPFRIIKIDKHFLWSADENENNQAIFRNMLHLAKDLRLKAVVEGVETKEQRDKLVQAGVSYLQGFYYSKPVPEQEFLRYIRTFNA